MMIIYGSMLCPDCVDCCNDLDIAGISYEFRSITEDLRYLKEFLKLRDDCDLFGEVKTEGKIGIPCLLKEDGTVTFDWK